MTEAEKFATLTHGEQESLRQLNAKLWAAEEWIRQRHAQSLAGYYGAGGLRRHVHGDGLFEDVETKVAVTCSLRQDHADWRADGDNIVAMLLLPGGCLGENNPRWNWNEFSHWAGHPLQGQYHCWLFHDLCAHVLDYGWRALLGIGGIAVDVTLVQQRAEAW